MNILWTIGAVMPAIAKELGIQSMHSVSWVDAMSQQLKKRTDVHLTIACSGAVSEVKARTIDSISYYVLPNDCNKVDYWVNILPKVKPNVIHIYGTETSSSKLLVANHSDWPIVISLQGILSEYQRHYYAGLDFITMVKSITFMDIVRPVGFFGGRNDFIRRSKNEKLMIRSVRYVEGRSTWDRVSSMRINPQLKYFYCPRMIRQPFYNAAWNQKAMEAHSIFVHQGNYSIKCLHYVLEALSILKTKYPDIKLHIAGNNIFEPKTFMSKIKKSGYINYIQKLIRKYNIKENIVFTGYLTADRLADYLTRMNVAVIPSAIENAPNSLAEAQLVGTPCIATYVGGNMDMMEHNKEGFLYCFNEPNMLAEYINQIFESPELAASFSEKGKQTAKRRHDPQTLETMLLEIYNNIISDTTKQ